MENETIRLGGHRGLTRLLCIFPWYLTVPFFTQVYMVTSKLSVNYLKFSFKSILIKWTIRLRPKIALLRLWVYGGRGNVESLLLCPWVRPSVRPYTCKRCYSDSFKKMAERKFPSCLYDPKLTPCIQHSITPSFYFFFPLLKFRVSPLTFKYFACSVWIPTWGSTES